MRSPDGEVNQIMEIHTVVKPLGANKDKLLDNVNTRNRDSAQLTYQNLRMCQITMSFSGSIKRNCSSKKIRNLHTRSKFKKIIETNLTCLYRD